MEAPGRLLERSRLLRQPTQKLHAAAVSAAAAALSADAEMLGAEAATIQQFTKKGVGEWGLRVSDT